MRVFLSIKNTVGRELDEIGHHLLKGEESIAFCDSSEVLAIFIGVWVEDKSCELVHALRVWNLRVFLEVNVDDASQTVVIIRLLLVFYFRKVDLWSFYAVFIEQFSLEELYLVLFLKKLAFGLCSHCILLDDVPKILIIEEILPLRLL